MTRCCRTLAAILAASCLLAARPGPRIARAMPGAAATSKPATTGPAEQQRLAQFHARLIDELKLAGATKAAARKIFAQHRRDLAAWDQQNGPEMAKLRLVLKKFHGPRTAETSKQIRAAVAQMRKLQAGRRAIEAGMPAKLKEALSAEQMAVVTATIRPPRLPSPSSVIGRFHMLEQLDLSKEKLGTIKKIIAESRRAAADKGPMPSQRAMKLAWNRVVKEVLTKADLAKLADLMQQTSHKKMVLAMFSGLYLTAGQRAKIDAIWQKAYAQGKANPSRKYQIYIAAQKEAVEKVLTDVQREQLNRRGKRTSGRRPPHGK